MRDTGFAYFGAGLVVWNFVIMPIHHKNGGVIIFILTNNIQFLVLSIAKVGFCFYDILEKSF